ncbi:MAG: hypothetical protein JXB62_16905 [Pirellulales bacterium]|nr:hypothetical protein [Pirellulales bacterium]
MSDLQLGTGLPALDRVFRGLMPGDNIVWQIDTLDDYRPFVEPYMDHGLSTGRRLVYFRFADHPPLLADSEGIEVCRPAVEDGFEQVVTEVHNAIRAAGTGAVFVFDVLSDLATIWGSDRMLGNFFLLTCPFIYDLQSLAYFALQRGAHSLDAITPISHTTQILLDVYEHQAELYIHPVKVQHRHSPTMYMLHVWRGQEFLPVNDSSTTADILTERRRSGMDSARWQTGIWSRTFLEGEEAWQEWQACQPPAAPVAARAEQVCNKLLRMAVTRDARVLELAKRYFSLGNVLSIGRRMIGTGRIGGKTVGMLLSRAILQESDPRWQQLLEAHDSFFVGSDVFYTFLVENGCWWLRQKQRDPASVLDGLDEARRRILMGSFPAEIERKFAEMLDYFGQSPIIVRSSSLLEDNFGNAFSGKYESVFCANQGPPTKRIQDFLSAVRTIYASTMSEKALRYRAQRALLDQDEQMGLLVQRVSGTRHQTLFFPEAAGVGLSFNPYVWSSYIDPEAGMLRLVFGLGTRAVDRSDNDYTRVVALNAPQRRPEGSLDEVRQYSQRYVDVIDLDANQVVSREFADVVQLCPQLPVQMFTSTGTATGYVPLAAGAARPVEPLTFERLLKDTSFVADMREMLQTLQKAYGLPVDVEFTANTFGSEQLKINVVQCRPLQVMPSGAVETLPAVIPPEDLILEAQGAVIGHARSEVIDRVVYVVPSVYGELTVRDRYAVARAIGKLLHVDQEKPPKRIMLVGPGRWGTTTPSLGVPVSFTEIDTAAVLCEIVAMREELIPDVSLGTHFFNDLVEMDILYIALFPDREHNSWNRDLLENAPNRLEELAPSAARWADAVRVIEPANDGPPGTVARLHASAFGQRVTCYLDRRQEP